MKKTAYLLGVLLSVYTFQGCNSKPDANEHVENAQETNENKPNLKLENDDMEFLTEAAAGGMMEVELGKLASEKGMDPSVKDFGQKMVTDHSKANEELKALAAQKNVTLPAGLSEKEQNDVNDLRQKSGKDFDEDYMDLMVKDHNKDVDKFEDEANDAKDADVKAFAAKYLPILKEHQSMAKSTEEAIDKKHKDDKNYKK